MTSLAALGLPNTDFIIPCDEAYLQRRGLQKGCDNVVGLSDIFSILGDFPDAEKSVGGSSANLAVGFGVLGGEATFYCTLGDDEAAAFYVTHFPAGRAKCQAYTETGKASPFVALLASPDGHTTPVVTDQNIAAVQMHHIDWESVSRHDIVHIEAGLLETAASDLCVDKAVAVAFDNGLPLSFTLPACGCERAMTTFDRRLYMHSAGFVFGNLAEYKALTGLEALEDMCGLSLETDALLVVTLGDRGAAAFQRGQSFFQKSVPATVVNPVGAGDNFAAGFLSCFFATGGKIQESLLHGAATASKAVGRKSAQLTANCL